MTASKAKQQAKFPKVQKSMTARNMKEFARMRAKETGQKQGMFIVPETRAVDFAADSHKYKAQQLHEGFVRKPMIKKLEKATKKRKRSIRQGRDNNK
jgi:hypothetical protein